MLYENFLDSIRLEVEKRLPPGCRVSLVRVQKNNGTPFDGLSFTEKGSRYSPTVYLDAFYQEYLRGMSLEHIARLLIQAYQGGQPVPTRQLEQALDFEMAKTNIVFRLINSNANRDRLGALPHRDFLDLSLIYCLLVDDNEDRQMTSTVTLEQMTAWGITEDVYKRQTMGSVLNGLGETRLTFVHNVLALLLRLAFVVFLIPRHGILAYLWGMLASELFLALLHMSALGKQVGFPLDAVSMIVKPGVCLVISVGILYALAPAWRDLNRAVEVEFVVPGAQIAVLTAVYGGLLGLLHRPEPSEP